MRRDRRGGRAGCGKDVVRTERWVSPRRSVGRSFAWSGHFWSPRFQSSTLVTIPPRLRNRRPNTRPYQPLPIQWSNHIETEEGQLRHEEFLCRDQKDPREEIATRLLASVGDKGSICVYSEYERFVLLSLADVLPHLRQQLHQVVSRLWDLLSVVQHHYYHPQFRGSFSIKSVLPSLVPSLGYQDLEIQDGSSASSTYHRVVFRETDWVERERLAQALLQYCQRDTLAMVEIRRVLKSKASTPSGRPS